MQRNKRNRTPRGTAVDGFVRRNRVGASARRASLDTVNTRRRAGRVDGFVPRQSVENTSKSVPKSTKWTDENTLTISDEDFSVPVLDQGSAIKGSEAKPKFWELGKKHRIKKGKPPLSRKQIIIRRTALVLAFLLALVGAFLIWKFILNTSKVLDGNILGFFNSTKLRGEDEGRVNILLAGTSEDDIDHDGADLTDSIMLVSIDTRNNTGFTVSIPRDLWVRYGQACSAGFEGKINVAYQCGKANNFSEVGYAKGGMGLLQKVVAQNFDIPIHYYGKINYTAFRDAVDAVGGITVNIDSDDPRGIYDPNIQPKDGGPVLLKNGDQKLSGKLALALARSRNVAGGYGLSRGDFDRTTYQRKMLLALKDKALSAGVISNPAKVADLLDAAGNNVKTDFNSSEVRRLYELSKLVKNEEISSIDLAAEDVNLVTTGSFGGQSIVQPVAGVYDFSEIKRYFKKLTSTDPVVKEDSSAVVLNASGIPGLAQRRADELSVKGISIDAVGNAASNNATLIIDKTNGKNSKTRAFLESTFGITATTQNPSSLNVPNYNTDFIIVIGQQDTSSTN